MLGYAVGVIGMSIDDFCRSTPTEFSCICEACNQRRTEEYQDEWERIRTLAAIVIQPHVSKRITPRQLLPLPWDKKIQRQEVHTPVVSREEDKKRLMRLVAAQRNQS